MSRDDEFNQLAQQTSAGLIGRALLLTGNWHVAEELAQETLARVYAQWPRVRRDGNPVGYAYTVLYRLAIDRRRRRSSTELADGTVPDAAAHLSSHGVRSSEGSDDHLDLMDALQGLGSEERFVVVARYLDDLPVAEVATTLGRTDAWVRTTSSRALKKLRAHPSLSPVAV